MALVAFAAEPIDGVSPVVDEGDDVEAEAFFEEDVAPPMAVEAVESVETAEDTAPGSSGDVPLADDEPLDAPAPVVFS